MTINPAFLTFDQYLDIINKDRKRHPDSAYDTTVKTLNSYAPAEDYPELLKQFTSNGRSFEMRQKVTNLWDLSYVKTDDNGETMRSPDGEPVYMTRDEVASTGKSEFEYEQAIIDKATGKVVGNTANEWGCLLVQVAREYQGLGLGPMLSYENRRQQPERVSGGMTSGGENACYKAYQRMVAEHLTQGKYREALLDGDIAFNDIARILKSARVVGKYVEAEKSRAIAEGDTFLASLIKKHDWGRSSKSRFDLDFQRKEDIRLYADESLAILYNARLFELLDDKKTPDIEVIDNFIEEGILGYAYVGGTYDAEPIPKLFRVYGQNDSTRSLMAEVMMNTNIGLPVRVLDSDMGLLRDQVAAHSDIYHQERSPFNVVTLETPTLEALPDAISLEAMDRRRRDNPYGDYWNHIQELAYKISENDYEERLEREEPQQGARSETASLGM